MRIKCPNCDAQYEVPDEVVPTEGRDVQCSSCGQTWFQSHPDYADDPNEGYDSDAVMPEPEPLVDDEPDDDEEYQETPISTPPRKELDPSVEEILREEGSREAAERVADAEPENLETQTDLGLEDRISDTEEDVRIQAMNERMARMRGETADTAADGIEEITDTFEEELSDADIDGGEAAAAAAALGSRRDLLPDIEEINSTLRSTGDRDAAGTDPHPDAPIRNRKKRGFRRGFLLAVLLVVIAVLIYLLAPKIAEAIPQTDPMLNSYTAWVDGMRGSLDTRMQSMLQWLDDTAAASSSNS
jgi:predicted Zn finger-like uncharacterized protein